MNKFIKRILSASLGCAAIIGATQCVSFASPVTEADIAADIQNNILKACHGKALLKKIKSVKNEINDNEKRISKLEDAKLELESEISAKRSKCNRLNAEINACPYCNCRDCISLYNKVKRLKADIAVLKSELKEKKHKLELAKAKREKLDGKLAVLLQNKELKSNYI